MPHAEAADHATVALVRAELPNIWHSKLSQAQGAQPAPALPLSGAKRKASDDAVTALRPPSRLSNAFATVTNA